MFQNKENIQNCMKEDKPLGFRANNMVNRRKPLGDIKNLQDGQPQIVGVKRGKPEKNGSTVDNNPPFVPRRPLTRKFAATLKLHKSIPPSLNSGTLNANASMDSCSTTTTTTRRNSCSTTTNSVSSIIILMDEEREDDSLPDMNIDRCDCGNPVAVVGYVDDIYAFYRKAETALSVSPNYMVNQIDINEKMRAILIDWLVEVHYKFELMEETLFLTVNIIDRFLAQQTIVRKKLQLVGVTALLLACKYEEVSVPVVEDLILISDRAYTRKELLDMEKLILNTLNFNMSVPTPYVFMRRFLKAVAFNSKSDKKLELLSSYLVDLCLVEYKILKYRPSMLAAAGIYTAHSVILQSGHWSRTCEFHTTYSEEQLLECSRLMVEFHQNAGTGKLTGVHRKYSTSKFGCIAKSEPALFLLG